MSNSKTPKCLWCHEAVETPGTCDAVCARLRRVYLARNPVEPVALVISDDVTESADQQYHGDGYRG